MTYKVNTSFFFSLNQKGCNYLPFYSGKIIGLQKPVDSVTEKRSFYFVKGAVNSITKGKEDVSRPGTDATTA
jgi:hypothetical protein